MKNKKITFLFAALAIVVVVSLVYAVKYYSGKIQIVTIQFPDGSIDAGDEVSKKMFTYDQVVRMASYYGFSLSYNPEGNQVIIEEIVAEEEEPVDVGLKPLVKDETAVVRERQLYGDWVGSDSTGAIVAYYFSPTDEFGPYTVVELNASRLDIEGNPEDARIGFYEITDAGVLKMLFKRKLDTSLTELIEIEEEQAWFVTQNDVFISLQQGDKTLLMSKVEATDLRE